MLQMCIAYVVFCTVCAVIFAVGAVILKKNKYRMPRKTYEFGMYAFVLLSLVMLIPLGVAIMVYFL